MAIALKSCTGYPQTGLGWCPGKGLQWCCCLLPGCPCNCNYLTSLWGQLEPLKIEVFDQTSDPANVVSSPDPIVLNPGGGDPGERCYHWTGPSSFSCGLPNVTWTFRCEGDQRILIPEPETTSACAFSELQLVNDLCTDSSFFQDWEADVVEPEGGPPEPTCVAPCLGTRVLFRVSALTDVPIP